MKGVHIYVFRFLEVLYEIIIGVLGVIAGILITIVSFLKGKK